MVELTLKEVESRNKDLLLLFDRLDDYLSSCYPDEGIYGLDQDDPQMNEIVFVVVYYKDVAIGCGAIRPLDKEFTELKRFYVDPAYRMLGVGRKLITYLEQRAQGLGFAGIRLETGTEQPESLQFYAKCGYTTRGPFGTYEDNIWSLFYEKRLINEEEQGDGHHE